MKKYIQEEICTSRGFESRYQVMPLNEDRMPARYHFIDASPINEYALVDLKVKGRYDVVEITINDDQKEAFKKLMELVELEK